MTFIVQIVNFRIICEFLNSGASNDLVYKAYSTCNSLLARTWHEASGRGQKAYDFETWHEASGKGALLYKS